MDSIDYDQALAEGYAIFDQSGAVKVLPKRRVHTKSLIMSYHADANGQPELKQQPPRKKT